MLKEIQREDYFEKLPNKKYSGETLGYVSWNEGLVSLVRENEMWQTVRLTKRKYLVNLDI